MDNYKIVNLISQLSFEYTEKGHKNYHNFLDTGEQIDSDEARLNYRLGLELLKISNKIMGEIEAIEEAYHG